MDKFEYNTEQFTATIGINEGYSHNNELSLEKAVEAFINVWREAALNIEKELGIFVTVRLNTGRVVYQTEKGCPINGEDVLILQGTRNPYYNTDPNKWRHAVISAVEKIKSKFGQVTIQVIFQPIELTYMKS